MNNTINQQLFEKMINLSIIVGDWSKCVNNIQTRNISIYDQNNNSYSFNKEQLNKQGIFITKRASKCPKDFVWEASNYTILIVILMFITCVFLKWCLSSGFCDCSSKKKIISKNNNIEITVRSNTKMPIDSSGRNSPDVEIL